MSELTGQIMTDREWWEKVESLEKRYPDLDVKSAFSSVVDAYTRGEKLRYGVELPAEFVTEVLLLVRFAVKRELGEEPKPKITPTATAVVMMDAPLPQAAPTPSVAELEKRPGCSLFGKKG
jgi:hypothetical protein